MVKMIMSRLVIQQPYLAQIGKIQNLSAFGLNPLAMDSFVMTMMLPIATQSIVDQPHFFGISRGVVNGQDRIWVWNYDGTTKSIGVPYEVDQWVHISFSSF